MKKYISIKKTPSLKLLSLNKETIDDLIIREAANLKGGEVVYLDQASQNGSCNTECSAIKTCVADSDCCA